MTTANQQKNLYFQNVLKEMAATARRQKTTFADAEAAFLEAVSEGGPEMVGQLMAALDDKFQRGCMTVQAEAEGASDTMREDVEARDARMERASEAAEMFAQCFRTLMSDPNRCK